MKKTCENPIRAASAAQKAGLNQPMSRAGFLKGVGAATIAGAAAMAGPWAMAGSKKVQKGGKKAGTVTYLEPAGLIYLDTDRAGWWDRYWNTNHRVSQDYLNIADALSAGGTVILKPGVYFLHHMIDFPGFDLYDYPLVANMGSDFDVVLKGEGVDENGPRAVIDLLNYWALGAHQAYDEFNWRDENIPTTTQLIENIQFTGGVTSTSFGQWGKVDLTIKKCKFANCGGITCHPLGRVAFEDNVMENTVYGFSVVNWNGVGFAGGGMAYCDVLVKGNSIKCEGNAINLEGLGYNLWSPTDPDVTGEPRSIEVRGNECEVTYSFYCIGTTNCRGTSVIHHNTCVHNGPNYAGISINGSNEEDGAVVKSNTITSAFNDPELGAPWTAISLTAASGVTVQSNKVNGAFYWPILISEGYFEDFYVQHLGQESEGNAFIGNNLNDTIVLPDLPSYQVLPPGWYESGFRTSHYLFALGSAYNSVRGGGSAASNIVVYDVNGSSTTNLVAGLDHRIGHMLKNDPNYLTMQQAMSGKFKGMRHRVDWWNGEDL